MAGTFLLEVATPEKLLLSQQVDELIAPGSEGEFGVLPGHVPLLTALATGIVTYQLGSEKHAVAIGRGFAEVAADKATMLTPKKVTILAEIAEKAEDIDFERAEAAVRKAEERLQVGGLPSDLKEAQISLEKARLRRKIAERARRS